MELRRINGALSACSNIGVVVGPLVGGAIVAVVPTNMEFTFMLACTLAAIVPALGFRPTLTVSAGAGTDGGKGLLSFVEGVRTVVHSSTLTLLFWVGFVCFMGYGAFDPLESLFYHDVLEVDVSWMGWFSGAAGVGAVLGAFTPLQNTLVQAASDLSLVGRVSAIMNFGFNAAGVLPLLAAPMLADALGVQGALIAASSVVAAVPAMLLIVQRMRTAST